VTPEPTATHAALSTFRVDLSREADQRRGLEELIIPSVRKAPGFVAGHWTVDREAAESTVLLLFESAADAAAAVEGIRGNAGNQARVGIELVSVRIVEVVASV
jgi:hypothetical protein